MAKLVTLAAAAACALGIYWFRMGGDQGGIRPRTLSVKEVQGKLEKFSTSLTKVHELNQAQLNQLYAEAKEVIDGNGPVVIEEMRKTMPQLVAGDLSRSFFLVGSWIRYSEKPQELVKVIWDQSVVHNPDLDPHHPELDSASKLERIKSYALVELRKKNKARPLSQDEESRQALVKDLTKIASDEKSLDIAIGAFQLLNDLDEKEAVELALKSHSERDHELIAGVLAVE